jgi:tripartite-type tricarboxylate transporter receptor subunit TctC
VTRAIASALAERLHQPFVVENRPGADTAIGTEYVARSRPDGYTLIAISASHATNPATGQKLRYDSVKDFVPITQTVAQQLLLVVHPSLPVTTVKELIDYAKANPGKLNYGSTSSSTQLPMELFNALAGVRIVNVPYKGAAPMLNDLLGGHIQLAFGPSVAVIPQVQAGKLRALAIGDLKGSAVLPEVPTVAEAGVPGYQATGWFGLAAPAATPRPIVELLHAEVAAIVQSAAFRERLAQLGADPVGSTPEQFGEFIEDEISKWTRIASQAGIKAAE